MQKVYKTWICTLILAVAIPFLTHCGDESVSDLNARSHDRDVEQQKYTAKINSSVVGVYQTSTPGSNLVFQIDPCSVTGIGSSQTTIGMSSLCGKLVVYPKIKTTANSNPLSISYPFPGGGNFDGHTVSLGLEQNGPNPSNISCVTGLNNSVQQLKCNWSGSTPNDQIPFNKTTKKAVAYLNTPTKSDNIYVGHNGQFNIVLQLNSSFITNPGSQTPMPTIRGNVIFFDLSNKNQIPTSDETQAPYAVQSGTFDPFSDTLSLTVGDNGFIQMNCVVKNLGNKLECTSNSRVYQGFTLVQTTRH